MGHRVETDNVGGPEPGRRGPAQRRSKECAGLGAAQTEFTHPVEHRGHAERADAVTNEVGSVLAVDDALPQYVLSEFGHRPAQIGVGVIAGNHLEEAHVADRIEEMSHHEVTPELLAASLGHVGYRES